MGNNKQRCWQCKASVRPGESLCPKCGAVIMAGPPTLRTYPPVKTTLPAGVSPNAGVYPPVGVSPNAGAYPPVGVSPNAGAYPPPGTYPYQPATGGSNQPQSWSIYSSSAAGNPRYGYQASGVPRNENDASSFLFAVLGFFFPLVGLILFAVWQSTMPLRAKSAGIGALVGVIAGIASTCLFFIVIAAMVPYTS